MTEQATLEQSPPDLSRPEGADGSPPQEQAPPGQTPPVAQSNPKPQPNVQALQAGLTQTTQKYAQVKAQLGLDRLASPDDLLAAVTAVQQQVLVQGHDEAVMDPGIAQQQADVTQAAWGIVDTQYGKEFSAQAQHLQDVVFATSSPIELAASLAEIAASLAAPPQNGQPSPPAPPNGAAPGEQAAVPQPPAAPDGQMEPGVSAWKAEPDAATEVGTGDTEGFFGSIFGNRRR